MSVKAPWTDEQVAALNAYQRLGYVHEFTCPDHHEGSRVLVAHREGWTRLYFRPWIAKDSALTLAAILPPDDGPAVELPEVVLSDRVSPPALSHRSTSSAGIR